MCRWENELEKEKSITEMNHVMEKMTGVDWTKYCSLACQTRTELLLRKSAFINS